MKIATLLLITSLAARAASLPEPARQAESQIAPADLFPVVHPLPLHLEHSYCPACGQPLTGCTGYGVAFGIAMGDSLHAICQKQSAHPLAGGRIWCDACVLALIARSAPAGTPAAVARPAAPADAAIDLYADSVPAALADRLLDGHGFGPAQRAAFAVVRILPLELGGTNAPANLRVIPARDAPWRARAVALVLLRVRQGLLSRAEAARSLATFDTSAP